MKNGKMIDLIKIYKLISRSSVSFIGSVSDNGFPNIKAMLKPRKIDKNNFYFTTNTASMRVAQFQKNEKACIYFYKKSLFIYQGIMLTGKMEVLFDREIKEEIWRSGDTMYYKQGIDDPDYCVLKFTADKGRYYCDLHTQEFDF